MAEKKYDISGVCYNWLVRQGISNLERQQLLAEIREGLIHSANAKRLIAEIGQSAADQQLNPVSVLTLGLNYGIALGVLLEQERWERHLRKVV